MQFDSSSVKVLDHPYWHHFPCQQISGTAFCMFVKHTFRNSLQVHRMYEQQQSKYCQLHSPRIVSIVTTHNTMEEVLVNITDKPHVKPISNIYMIRLQKKKIRTRYKFYFLETREILKSKWPNPRISNLSELLLCVLTLDNSPSKYNSQNLREIVKNLYDSRLPMT